MPKPPDAFCESLGGKVLNLNLKVSLLLGQLSSQEFLLCMFNISKTFNYDGSHAQKVLDIVQLSGASASV